MAVVPFSVTAIQLSMFCFEGLSLIRRFSEVTLDPESRPLETLIDKDELMEPLANIIR